MRHGSHLDPPKRFERTHCVPDAEQLAWDDAPLDDPPRRPIEYLPDASASIVATNDSPDIPFRYSVNPYRGCAHGCAYCYARPYHDYLGLNAGLDFETKILVKHDAPRLLRDFLARDSWRGELIAFSGVTDCYQPAERQFRLTRGCLEVAAEAGQPVAIVTKNALVVRDLDLLQPMARRGTAAVSISLTTLDAPLARDMEPRTSTPQARLRAMQELATAGIPVQVMVAPIIPGLNDSEIPQILAAARDAGARSAGYILLRLPLAVADVFLEWLHRARPLQAPRVLGHIRQTRAGRLSSAQFGERMRGTGPLAEQIRRMFDVFAAKLGLQRRLPELRSDCFRHPRPSSGRMRLFD